MSMTAKRFRAAAAQTLARLGDVEHNIALATDLVNEAVRQGAELVVLPECMNTGYLFDSPDHCRALAGTVPDGRFVSALAGLARQHGIYLASGITEWDPVRQRLFNTGIMLDRNGDVAVHYHKQFLATHDQNWFAFGERGCPVVDTDLGRIGLLICFDGRIPEIARCLALQGAEIIVDMANFFAMDQAEMWGPARVFENGVCLVASTKAGVERSIYYPGGSMIVAPTGDVVAKMPHDTHGVVSAEIDTAAAAYKKWPSGGDKLADRRPELYGLLARPFNETPLSPLLEQSLRPEQATTKTAAVQSHMTQRVHSLDAALAMAGHAAKLGAKVIVLPQHFNLDTWLPDAFQAGAAAKNTADILGRAAQIARTYECGLMVPVMETTATGIAPTAVLVGPEGKVDGRHQQVHLEPELRNWASAGGEFRVFDTPFGRIGMMLGYDGLYPESARMLTLLGADIITWSCAWRHRYERELLAVPKAEDNRVYLVCANRTDCPYPGGSLVITPAGFPHWDINVSAPPVLRHGAVMPGFVNLALARQKKMIPKVDMVRNRLVQTYGPLVASARIAAAA